LRRELLGLFAAEKGRKEHANRLFDLAKLLDQAGRIDEAAESYKQLAFDPALATDPPSFLEWRVAALSLGLGPASGWKSQAVRAHVWSALDDYLMQQDTASPDLESIAWDRLRFRFERTIRAAEPNAMDKQPMWSAAGGLMELKAMPDLPAGIFRLTLEILHKGEAAPQKYEGWILASSWDVDLYLVPRTAAAGSWLGPRIPDERAERRKMGALAFSSILNSGPAGRDNFFALVASTTVDLPAGKYRFRLTCDDGARLLLDDRPLVDDWTAHPAQCYEPVVEVEGGRHRLRVDFFNVWGPFQLWMQVGPDNGPITALPVEPRLLAERGEARNGARASNELAWRLATSADLKERDPRRAVELAIRAVEWGPSNRGYWNTLGVAYYRVGEPLAAMSALNKSMKLSQGGDAGDYFFLAMAHWKLGDKEQSLTWYRKGVQWMDSHAPGDQDLRRFREEAAILLGIAQLPPATRPATRPDLKSNR
jgi:tetratricopeptide (TPR) repeat protein